MKSGTEKAADEAAGKQKLDTEPGDGRTAAENQQLMKAEFPQKTGEAFLPTSEEISMYLHASEDENPIHQGKAAVVPGFLMVNRILEGYGGLRLRHRSVFICPLRCEEPAETGGTENRRAKPDCGAFHRPGTHPADEAAGEERRRNRMMNTATRTAATMSKERNDLDVHLELQPWH